MKNKTTEQKYIESDNKNKPIGKYATNFRNYQGSLVRSHVHINIDEWKHVESGLKDVIWEDFQKEFNIDGDDEKKKHFLKVVGVRWTAFKTRLVRDFIKKKHPKYDHPSQLYPSITEEKWKKFVSDHQSEKFKALGEIWKARESQSHNEHPHFLGPGGYARVKAKWVVSDPISSLSSCASLRSSIGADDRNLDWIEKAQEVSQGTFVPPMHNDILNASLGKKEHPGRVRGVGRHMNMRSVFGQPSQTSRRSSGVVSINEVRVVLTQEIMQQMQSKSDALQAQFNMLFEQVKNQCPQTPSTNQHVPSKVNEGVDFNTPSHSHLLGDPRSSFHSVCETPFLMGKKLRPQIRKTTIFILPSPHAYFSPYNPAMQIPVIDLAPYLELSGKQASPDKEKLDPELKSLCDELSRTLRETGALLVDFVRSHALLGHPNLDFFSRSQFVLEQKKQKVFEINTGIDQAEALIPKMDLEAQSLQPNIKAVLLAKLREYKSDLNNLKSTVKRTGSTNLNQAVRDELLEAEMANTVAYVFPYFARLSELNELELICSIPCHPYHTAGLTCLTINSDSTLALSGSSDGSAHFVNISTGKVVLIELLPLAVVVFLFLCSQRMESQIEHAIVVKVIARTGSCGQVWAGDSGRALFLPQWSLRGRPIDCADWARDEVNEIGFQETDAIYHYYWWRFGVKNRHLISVFGCGNRISIFLVALRAKNRRPASFLSGG
ncbi:vesicle transport v-snare 13 [Phtheirospermum japonicum]|uniref:Vesicle transport v-snare 13 n=1 Tax=Phtheirospermum japonicum TaxID=374723 RepID=A0A830BQN4_9LAMI|nr:vesicle transport v-snare 13 [Phtheirospermum japonicum]